MSKVVAQKLLKVSTERIESIFAAFQASDSRQIQPGG